MTLEGSVFCVIKKGLPTSHFIPLSTLPSFNPLIQVVFIECLPDVWLALTTRGKQASPILIDWLYYLVYQQVLQLFCTSVSIPVSQECSYYLVAFQGRVSEWYLVGTQ